MLSVNGNTYGRPRNTRRLSILPTILIVVMARCAAAAEQNDKAPPDPDAPYCGLYSLYAAALHEGLEINFSDLLKPQYIQCPQGSTLANLQQAAVDLGLYAVPAINLTIDVLRHADSPVILHVKKNPSARDYDHYIVFLGVRNGLAAILDAPKPVDYVPFERLSAIWDGTGLIVSSRPIDLNRLFAASRWLTAGYMAAGLAATLALRLLPIGWTRPPTPRQRLLVSTVQLAILCAVASILAVAYHRLSPNGFLSGSASWLVHPSAVGYR